MLVVALQFGLGREVLDLGPQVALQPAQEALDLRLLLPGSYSQHLLCQEGLVNRALHPNAPARR